MWQRLAWGGVEHQRGGLFALTQILVKRLFITSLVQFWWPRYILPNPKGNLEVPATFKCLLRTQERGETEGRRINTASFLSSSRAWTRPAVLRLPNLQAMLGNWLFRAPQAATTRIFSATPVFIAAKASYSPSLPPLTATQPQGRVGMVTYPVASWLSRDAFGARSPGVAWFCQPTFPKGLKWQDFWEEHGGKRGRGEDKLSSPLPSPPLEHTNTAWLTGWALQKQTPAWSVPSKAWH